MNNPSTNSPRSAFRRSSLFTLVCVLGLALAPFQILRAADAPTTPPATVKAAVLPLTATFEKVTGGENGPFVLKLKNTSDHAVMVSAKILLSVVMHADTKARHVPEHAIEAGQTWSIPDLAAADKVILTAKNFAPMEVVVP